MTKLFVTGATGYIGGDALYAIATTHPEYEITALVRNSDAAAQVAKLFPSIKFAFGDLDSVELIENEAKGADVVCQWANADHAGATIAIAKGLACHDPSHVGFFIHLSGTGLLLIKDIKANTFGEASDHIYNDLEGLEEIQTMDEDAPHYHTDKIVFNANEDRARTAIVSPGTIYGQGRGPVKQRSHQVPELARCTLEQGHGIKVNAGKTLWNHIHVHDLSNLFLKLVEAAAAGGSTTAWEGKPAVWGPDGYYFCENGEHVWGEVAQWIATEAHKQGLIPTDEVKSYTAEEATKFTPWGGAMWGANSRAKARRARGALKWEAEGPALKDEIKASVEVEARRLGLMPDHAKVAAGDT